MGADNLEECYAILDLAPGATEEEVRNAYLDLVKVWHPDRYGNESPRLRKRAEEKLKAVNQAYEYIRLGVADPLPCAPVETTAPGSGASSLSVLLYPKNFGDSWGYVNAAGQLAIGPRFEFAAPFSDSLARVREDGRWGFIDRLGEYTIAPTFADAKDFSQGLAAVVFREKWGYIDKAGIYVINALYDEAGQFSADLAAVLWRGRWGYIDRAGKFVINPRYHAAGPFERGWADVQLGSRWGRVNRFGEVFFTDKPEIGT